MKVKFICAHVAVLLLFASSLLNAQERFSELVGSAPVRPVQQASPMPIPFITWGGDVATFHANGGLTTKSGALYDQSGLKIKLTPGDDFIAQVKDYMSGKTPFLRGTFRMLGQASEVLGSDPRTKPVIILQLSWSNGDHIVGRESVKSLNDLKGKRIACQQGGPHVGLLYDSLDAAKLSRSDIEIEWVEDLTGPGGPAEAFRKDPSIDACCVITPDMLGLTGGFDSTGSGAEGTVKGAHVVNSTQQMSRSIADVYAVRSDWHNNNKEFVAKFAAGYLKATEDVVKMRDGFEKTAKMSDDYRELLSMSQSIFGKEVLPTLEVDAHGLLLDCAFVGLPGQIAFFQVKGNPSGFEPKMKSALDLAVNWGYAKVRTGFDPVDLDYKDIAETAKVAYVEPKMEERFKAEFGDDFQGIDTAGLDERTIVSFTIQFEPNQFDFSADRYGAEFSHAIEQASTFGNAAVVIRGHTDPTKTLIDLIQAGIKKGIIRRTGQRGNYRYFLNGRPLDLTQTDNIVKLIRDGAFSGTNPNPLETMQAALNLSFQRAEAVKQALQEFAKAKEVNLDLSQIEPVGAGISDPIIPKPESLAQAKNNMRVEFRIVRVAPEALKESDFDF